MNLSALAERLRLYLPHIVALISAVMLGSGVGYMKISEPPPEVDVAGGKQTVSIAVIPPAAAARLVFMSYVLASVNTPTVIRRVLIRISSVAAIVFAMQIHAAPAPVALVAIKAPADKVAACVAARLRVAGPVGDATLLHDGLEFRFAAHRDNTAPERIVITGLLKPAAVALAASRDDDPEAHPQVVARMFEMLRIHVGTRAWGWTESRQDAICAAAADWIDALRKHPIILDRISADGEALKSDSK